MVVRPRPLAEGMRESSCVGVKISPSLGHSRLQALGRGFIVVRSCRCHRTVSVGLRRILARAAGINWRKPNVKNQGAPEIEAAVMGAGHREAAVGPSAGGRVSTAMRTSARPANGGRMDGDRARGPNDDPVSAPTKGVVCAAWQPGHPGGGRPSARSHSTAGSTE